MVVKYFSIWRHIICRKYAVSGGSTNLSFYLYRDSRYKLIGKVSQTGIPSSILCLLLLVCPFAHFVASKEQYLLLMGCAFIYLRLFARRAYNLKRDRLNTLMFGDYVLYGLVQFMHLAIVKLNASSQQTFQHHKPLSR